MPILKERLQALTSAGAAIETEFLCLTEQINSYIFEAQQGTIPAEEALNRIQLLCLSPQLTIYKHHEIIREEQIRWHLTHRRADKEKLQKLQKRRSKGILPREAVQAYVQAPFSQNKLTEDKFMLEAMNTALQTSSEWLTAVSHPVHRPYSGYSKQESPSDPPPHPIYFCSCDNFEGFEQLEECLQHLRDCFAEEQTSQASFAAEDIVSDDTTE